MWLLSNKSKLIPHFIKPHKLLASMWSKQIHWQNFL